MAKVALSYDCVYVSIEKGIPIFLFVYGDRRIFLLII